jgi:hypothetical protein
MEELKMLIEALVALIPALGGIWLLVIGGLGLATFFAVIS